jgi:hypothetical protein
VPNRSEFSSGSAVAQWYVAGNGAALGPYSQEQLVQWLTNGRVSERTLVCPVGAQHWVRIADCPQLQGTQLQFPPPMPSARSRQREASIKNLARWHRRFTLGILAVIVGSILPLALAAAVSPMLWLFCYALLIGLQGWLVTGLALGSRNPWLWGIFGAIPYLGLLVLLNRSQLATARLRAAGVSVGLFGPKSSP